MRRELFVLICGLRLPFVIELMRVEDAGCGMRDAVNQWHRALNSSGGDEA